MVPGPSQELEALRKLTTQVLQARAAATARGEERAAEAAKAGEFLQKIDESVVKALDLAGKQVRVVKRRLAAVDRISDACDDLELAISAVAEARATNNFDPADVDEVLVTLKSNLDKLSAIVTRGSDSESEGMAWIRAVGKLAGQK